MNNELIIIGIDKDEKVIAIKAGESITLDASARIILPDEYSISNILREGNNIKINIPEQGNFTLKNFFSFTEQSHTAIFTRVDLNEQLNSSVILLQDTAFNEFDLLKMLNIEIIVEDLAGETRTKFFATSTASIEMASLEGFEKPIISSPNATIEHHEFNLVIKGNLTKSIVTINKFFSYFAEHSPYVPDTGDIVQGITVAREDNYDEIIDETNNKNREITSNQIVDFSSVILLTNILNQQVATSDDVELNKQAMVDAKILSFLIIAEIKQALVYALKSLTPNVINTEKVIVDTEIIKHEVESSKMKPVSISETEEEPSFILSVKDSIDNGDIPNEIAQLKVQGEINQPVAPLENQKIISASTNIIDNINLPNEITPLLNVKINTFSTINITFTLDTNNQIQFIKEEGSDEGIIKVIHLLDGTEDIQRVSLSENNTNLSNMSIADDFSFKNPTLADMLSGLTNLAIAESGAAGITVSMIITAADGVKFIQVFTITFDSIENFVSDSGFNNIVNMTDNLNGKAAVIGFENNQINLELNSTMTSEELKKPLLQEEDIQNFDTDNVTNENPLLDLNSQNKLMNNNMVNNTQQDQGGLNDQQFSFFEVVGNEVVMQYQPNVVQQGSYSMDITSICSGGFLHYNTLSFTISNVAKQPTMLNHIFNVNEGVDAGKVIGIVDNNNKSFTDNVSFKIVSGNINDTFAINEHTGELYVNKAFMVDFETFLSFDLQVAINDQDFSDQSNIMLNVINTNDTFSYTNINMPVNSNLMTNQDNVPQSKVANLLEVNDLMGSQFDDVLEGNNESNSLHGYKGDDTLIGYDGDDILIGEEGMDILLGGNGDDYLDGNSGIDHIDGGAGNDFIILDVVDIVINNCIQGGEGYDILAVVKNCSDQNIDLTSIAHEIIDNIEELNIENHEANEVLISQNALKAITDDNNQLFINGDAVDTVKLTSDFHQVEQTISINDIEYNQFTTGDATLYVNSDVNTVII